MPLNAQQTRRLAEINTQISQIENRLAVSAGLGDSHSSQGVSATFNDSFKWNSQLSLLRSLRDRLEALRDGTQLPPPIGTNLSVYRPEFVDGIGSGEYSPI